MTLAADDPRHGTENGYGNLKCRCADCTEAWRAYCQRRRETARAKAAADPSLVPHGTATGRDVMGCRCEPCRRTRYPHCWPVGVDRPTAAEVTPTPTPRWVPGVAAAWIALQGTEGIRTVEASVGAIYTGRRSVWPWVRMLPARSPRYGGCCVSHLDRLFPDLVSAIGSEAAVPPVAASDRVAEPCVSRDQEGMAAPPP